MLTCMECAKRERESRGWYQKEKGHKKSTKRGSRHFFQLHSNFNDILNYTLSSGFSGSGLIPIEGIPLFPFDNSRWMLRTA